LNIVSNGNITGATKREVPLFSANIVFFDPVGVAGVFAYALSSTILIRFTFLVLQRFGLNWHFATNFNPSVHLKLRQADVGRCVGECLLFRFIISPYPEIGVSRVVSSLSIMKSLNPYKAIPADGAFLDDVFRELLNPSYKYFRNSSITHVAS